MSSTDGPETRRKIIFLFGPTAVGKTQLLAEVFSGSCEVVNADSIQVYRKLDIGSAKASREEQSIIRHHLIDILDPWENYNTASFISLADEACRDIADRNLVPVVSGGTAFYFKNFLYGLSEAPKSNPQIREKVSSYICEVGLEEAYRRLCEVDPVSGNRININDSYRISRALEVYETCGKPLSSFALPTVPRNGMEVLSIGLCRDKDSLDERIGKRVEIMFDMGIVDEIKGLISIGACPEWQSMQGIGYREFFNVFWDGTCEGTIRALGNASGEQLRTVRESIRMNSIHYAKRQMTFFRSFSDVTWCDPQNIPDIKALVLKFVSAS